MSYLLSGDRIIMGTDYYPEHWDKSMWEEDLERMLETGIEVIRVAEFSWNKFEPKEGEYTWDQWHQPVSRLGISLGRIPAEAYFIPPGVV